MTTLLRSPLPWIGGKYYSAPHILRAFPVPSDYDIYVELFGGAAHVPMQKPPSKHVEVYNDLSGDLVNFWMHCRNQAQELEQRCRSLPYARELYYAYHKSLFDGTQLEPLERAARWFYVLRNSFSGVPPTSRINGWRAAAGPNAARAYHSALDLFSLIQQRMQFVQIDHRDFAEVFHSHDRPRVLFYVDPPYLGHEHYYRAGGETFSLADHQRLATLLNTAQAYVAISYYPDPAIDKFYPVGKWHRTTWHMPKHSQQTKTTRDIATELLLTNYEPSVRELWEEVSA